MGVSPKNMTNSTLTKLRQDIATVDHEIFQLIEKRMKLCEEVGQVKIEENLPIKDYSVEKQIIERARSKARSMGIYEDLVEAIYLSLIKYSVIKQDELVRTARTNLKSQGAKTIIVGGKGHMGQWLAQFFLSLGHEVTVFDPTNTSEAASEVEEVNSLKEAVLSSQYIILATPLSKTAEIVEEIIKYQPKGLLVEICSLKSPVRESIQNAIDAGLRVSSIHPMFGPSAQVLAGKNIVVCEGNGLETEDIVNNVLSSTSAKLVYLGMTEHDQLMSYVLGAAHIANIAFANLVSRSSFPTHQVSAVAGTTFQEQMKVSQEVIEENQNLYFEIQSLNKQSEAVIEQLEGIVKDLRNSIKTQDKQAFKDIMEEARVYFEAQ